MVTGTVSRSAASTATCRPRSVASLPAASASSARVRLREKRFSVFTWRSVSAVPIEATTLREAVLVRRDHVHVALDDDRAVGLADGVVGAVDAVDDATLVEHRRLRRVQVLRPVVGAEVAPAEAEHPAALVGDGEQQPAAEAVVAAAVALDDEARFDELARSEAALLEMRAQRVPLAGREAEPEVADRGVIEAAPRDVLARVRRVVGLPQPVLVEHGGGLVRGVEPLVALRLLWVAALQRDAGAIGEDAQRLGKLDVVALLHEREDVAAGAARAEAVPRPPVGRDDERGRPFRRETGSSP